MESRERIVADGDSAKPESYNPWSDGAQHVLCDRER